MEALDLFAGSGGWDLAALELGIDPLGIELDDAACATREAAGLQTLQADVAALDPADHEAELLLASPPCQAWSMAGKRKGELDRPRVFKAANRIAEGEMFDDLTAECEDPRSMLVVEPLRWVLEIRPRLVALEQVPPVLGLWRYIGELLREADYYVWVGVLEAERYGVPQTRKRAILVADAERPARPPAPTHQRYVKGEAQRQDGLLDGGLLPWVSMAEALGWNGAVGFPRRDDTGTSENGYRERDWRDGDEPAFAVTEKARSAVKLRVDEPAPTIHFGGRLNTVGWATDRPATTVAGDPRVAQPGHKKDQASPDSPGRMEGAVRVSLAEAAILQGFPPGYPFCGSRTKQFEQVGNAVPPPLAWAILRELVGDG